MPADIAPHARPALRGAWGISLPWEASAIVAWATTGVALAILYHAVIAHLVVQWWDDPNQSHGFLVPLVAGFMAWERRERLAAAGASASSWGLVLMGAGVGMLVLGELAAELFLQRVSLLVTLAGAIAHLLGRGALRGLAIPLLFLALMIPPPAIVFNAVVLPLQGVAARLATVMLGALGVPVLREGNLIVLATTTLEVAEACSGIRSLTTLLALAATLAYLARPGPWRAAAIIVSAVPVAVLANAARVAGTGALAARYGPEAALGFLYTFSGRRSLSGDRRRCRRPRRLLAGWSRSPQDAEHRDQRAAIQALDADARAGDEHGARPRMRLRGEAMTVPKPPSRSSTSSRPGRAVRIGCDGGGGGN